MAHSIDELVFHPFKGLEDTQEACLTLNNGYTVKILKGKLFLLVVYLNGNYIYIKEKNKVLTSKLFI